MKKTFTLYSFRVGSFLFREFLWGVLVLLCATSCADNYEETLSSGAVPVLFSPEVLSVSGDAATRVIDNTWTGSEQIGIHMLKGSATLPASAAFNTYKVTARSTDNKTATLGPTATGQTLYYPVDKANVGFVAFSPYKAPASNSVTYNAFTDQDTQAKMEAMDFIYHKTALSYNYSNSSVPLPFAHKFSKLIIHVKRDANTVTTTDFNKLTLTVGGIPTTVSVPLNTGAPSTASGSGTLTPYRSANSNDSKTYMGIIAPCAAASRTVTFAGVTTPSHTHAITTDFKSGYSYEFTFTLTQKGVVLTSTTVGNWGSGSVAWSGNYLLEISTNQVNAGYSAASGTVNIKTNWTGSKPVIRRSTSGTVVPAGDTNITWLSVGAVSGTSSPYSFTYNVTANTGTTARTAYIWVTAGTMSVPIKVTQAGDTRVKLPANDANCYILKPGGNTVTIPVTRAKYYSETYDSNHPSLGASEAFTAHVLWSDQPDLVTVGSVVKGAQGSFVVTSNTGTTQGNAVVVIRNASGQILWSWHIWVVNYNATKVTIGSQQFMSRNLGAINQTAQNKGSLGLLYQWGRKDPFTGASVFTAGNTQPAAGTIYMNGNSGIASQHPVVSHISNISITASLQQPHTFFAGWYDWAPAYDDQNTKPTLRWGNTSTKALDDPCPPNYKVPTSEQLSNGPLQGSISEYNVGYNINNNWWPACGTRDPQTGGMIVVAARGKYWSSRTSVNQSAHMLQLSSFGRSMITDHITTSCSIRCIPQ